ncbi:MAG TPA: hypothetical protein VL860_14650, partial [Planctomycetota bacterium]|nr:hypothetical protein [Planctomycetota bacterium]
MLSISSLRRLLAALFVLTCLIACTLAPAVSGADNAVSPDMILNRLSTGMAARHDGIQVVKVDPASYQITLKRGEGEKVQKLFLFVNQDAGKLEGDDFFEHFEYRGYEFSLKGNNNVAVVGGVDGLMDKLEAVTQYLKDNKIEPETLKKDSRINVLFAGELVFRWQFEDKNTPAQFFINGTVYHSSPVTPMTDEEIAAKCKDYHAASKALQDKIDADKELSYGAKKALIHIVEVAHETDPNKLKAAKKDDQLTDTFCRLVINDQYFERSLVDASGKVDLNDHFKAELAKWRDACKAVSAYKPKTLLVADDKSELTEYQNAWGNKLWVSYAGKTGETHLIIRHHEPDEYKLYMHRIFNKADPKDFDKLLTRNDFDRVAISFPFYGTLATYDLKNKQFECDVPRWNNAAKAFFPSNMNRIFLPPERMFPPHIPVYRYDGQVEGIVVPKGPIFPPDFRAIPADKRQAAHDAFLQELADKLDNPGNLHLLFEALSQYVFDTPDPRFPAIIGNSVQKSDIHQTADQTLDSRLGGRFIGDCDDMAEFYNKVTTLQGKQSFVMGVPGHATCGYVTKLENDKYQLNFLDTGPARELVRGELNQVIEDGVRSYDQENQMTFSPDQVEFLFRFAGESTRTPYVLSTRMFVDSKYAEAMIKVQSYWHYHTFNLGIQTMEKMLADGDKDSANYNEVASLYSWSRQWENCFKRHAECMAAIKKDDMLTGIEAKIRLADYQHDAQMYAEAVETLTGLNKTLAEVPQQDLQRVLEFIVQAGMMWVQVKEPYHGYEPLHRIMLLTRGNLFPPLAPGLVETYAA